MRWLRISRVSTLAVILASSPHVQGGDATLLGAIHGNDSATLQALLAGGADPNSRDANQDSALMYAALYASPRVVDLLIRAGADVNYRGRYGLTALTWAAYSFESAKLLIEAGADVNAKSEIGATPFVTAAAYPRNTALLQSMLDKGADVKTSVLGSTALIMATLTGDEDAVALLLEKGSDPNAPGTGGFSALHWAAKRGDRNMMRRLLDAGANPNLRTQRDEDILELYSFWNDPGFVRLLLERGINPTRKDAASQNALLFAASADTVTPEVFTMLLKDGPVTDARNAYGDGVLRAAQRRGDARIAKLLGGTVPPVEHPGVHAVKVSPSQIRNAAVRGLDLLTKTGPSVVKERGCVSCHHQSLPSLAGWYARLAGIDATQVAETNRKLVYPVLQRSNQLLQNGAAPAGEAAAIAWELIGLASDGQQPDLYTDAAVNYLAVTQMPDGKWLERWQRPPLEYSPISATAVSIRALDLYGFPSRRQEFDKRIGLAAAWLVKTQPAALEESTMRLLGLVWGKAPREAIDQAARQLASAQRSDGGWTQLPGLPPDAYATGHALVALRESGFFTAASRDFMRGVRYLLRTQEADGSWHVRGRALPLQSLFESGFPHGRDQWISAAGTSWATMALSLALRSGTPSAGHANAAFNSDRRRTAAPE
jgi:ankyrin repeat protein